MLDSSGIIIAADLSIFGEIFHGVNIYAPVGGINSPNDEQNRFCNFICVCKLLFKNSRIYFDKQETQCLELELSTLGQ